MSITRTNSVSRRRKKTHTRTGTHENHNGLCRPVIFAWICKQKEKRNEFEWKKEKKQSLVCVLPSMPDRQTSVRNNNNNVYLHRQTLKLICARFISKYFALNHINANVICAPASQTVSRELLRSNRTRNSWRISKEMFQGCSLSTSCLHSRVWVQIKTHFLLLLRFRSSKWTRRKMLKWYDNWKFN